MEQTAWHSSTITIKDPATHSEYTKIKCTLSLYTIPDHIIMSHVVLCYSADPCSVVSYEKDKIYIRLYYPKPQCSATC